VKAIVAEYRKAAADGLTQAEAATRLGKDRSTVHRVALKNGITFARGIIGRPADYGVVEVQGRTYSSVKDAADAEDVAPSAIYTHLRNGTPDRIGLRKWRRK